MTQIPLGSPQFFEGSMHTGSDFLLLGSHEEGGTIYVIDDAKDFNEAKQKALLFLEDNPNGGVLIEKHLCAVYRLPLFHKKES